MPPLAVRALEYPVPTVAPGILLVVMLTLDPEPEPETESVYLCEAFLTGEEESWAWTVKGKLPDCVAVPEITPVELVRNSPVGRDPELRLQW